MSKRALTTRRGKINLPAYIPVTTYGNRYPLDRLIQPYLPRLAQAVMVSYHYAKQIEEQPQLPLYLDSGGFASLFKGSTIRKSGSVGILEIQHEDEEGTSERVHPADVLDLQERIADVAFTLDFPIPPGMDSRQSKRRMKLTITNAHWALENRRRKDMLLFACIQAWDAESASQCAKEYATSGFDGVAIGGLVPRARDPELVLEIVRAVREHIPDLPLHVFGLGKPKFTEQLFQAGVDSVDSSAYVKMAASGKLWSRPGVEVVDPSPTDRLHLALCNLATASQVAIPLSMTNMVFSTQALETHMESFPD